MKNQTAIELLEEIINDIVSDLRQKDVVHRFAAASLETLRLEFLDEVKKAHRQQIIEAYNRGLYIGQSFGNSEVGLEYEKGAEEYYSVVYETK